MADVSLSDLQRSASPKRIFIYGINYAPEPTGVGRYTGELGAYLAQQGLEVDVVTAAPHYPGWAIREGYRNWFSTQSLAGVSVTRCPLFLKSEMGGIWRLVAPLTFAFTSAPVAIWRIIKNRPDTVLCIEPTLFSVPVALLAANLVGAKTVLHVQDLEIDAAFAVGHLHHGFLRRIATSFESFLLRRFDAVVTISNRMKERLEVKGVPSQRLSLVRNWVDLEKINPLNRPSKYRKELEIPNESFVALYAGNIGRKQALPIILDAAKKLATESRIVFVLAGDGPDKSRLMERYSQLSNVKFIPVQPEGCLCELLNLADVHLLPQDRDAADLVLPSKLGAMLASGKPSIVMADPGTELYEFLRGAVQLVPAGDVDALCEAVMAVRAGTAADTADRQRQIVSGLTSEISSGQLFRILAMPL